MSSLLDFVETLPDGINTFLGEKGARLSGGQKQRIAIARALYFDAEILLFDEATSALDTETEDKITESINSLGELKKTIIIIAHRYSTLKNCDVIYRMDNGTIVEKLSFVEKLLMPIISKAYQSGITPGEEGTTPFNPEKQETENEPSVVNDVD